MFSKNTLTSHIQAQKNHILTLIVTKVYTGSMAVRLLYPDLSYQIRGAIVEVRNIYGASHKELVYQKALEEELQLRKIPYQREVSIAINSPKTGKVMGIYRPDFIVDSKIIIEMKALEFVPQRMVNQLFDYLKNSIYELGYFVNFGGEKLFMRRIIYTNDHKNFRTT